MRYAHLAEDTKKEAVNVLNGLTDKKNRDCHKTVTNPNLDEFAKPQPPENTVNI